MTVQNRISVTAFAGELDLDGQPRYVTRVEAASNRVFIGTSDLLGTDEIEADHVRWCGPAASGRHRLGAQIRAHGEATPAHVRRIGDGADATLEITLHEPVRGVAPGQAAVLYRSEPDGDRVLGSGTISASRPATEAV